MRLYDIATEYRDAAAKLADLDLDDQTIADTLEGMQGDLTAKIQNVAFVEQEARATVEAIDKAIKNMQARKDAIAKRADNIRKYMHDAMMVAGVRKVESEHFVLAIKNNPESVDVYEPGLIPAEYMRQPEQPPPAPNKVAIKAALKAGQDVLGCRLVQSTRLDIK